MKKFILLLLLSGSTQSFSQSLKQRLPIAVHELLNSSQLKYASLGLTVQNANTGETVYAHNPNQGLVPASTQKVITSITALSQLGEHYRYRTTIGYSGSIDANGVLHGDLIIKGSGDPTLGSWRFDETKEPLILEQIKNAIKFAGINKIEGLLIADDSAFPTQSLPDGWVWQDIGNYYGAGSSALTWRENQFDILLKPGKSKGGATTLLTTKPPMDYISLQNEVKTGSSGVGDDAFVYLPPYSDKGYVRGEIGLDESTMTISAAVPDPAYEAAFRIKNALLENGVTLNLNISTSRRMQQDGKAIHPISTTLLEIQSPELSTIVYWFNKKSVNLYGEQLIRTLAKENGKMATTNNGIEIERDFWSAKGVDKNSLIILDGSGLSPANRVTTQSMVQVLSYARSQPWFNTFYSSLPEINGLKMKDGYINGVRAYAGYVNSKDGNTYVFSFIVNNFSSGPREMREKMWKLLDVLK